MRRSFMTLNNRCHLVEYHCILFNTFVIHIFYSNLLYSSHGNPCDISVNLLLQLDRRIKEIWKSIVAFSCWRVLFILLHTNTGLQSFLSVAYGENWKLKFPAVASILSLKICQGRAAVLWSQGIKKIFGLDVCSRLLCVALLHTCILPSLPECLCLKLHWKLSKTNNPTH